MIASIVSQDDWHITGCMAASIVSSTTTDGVKDSVESRDFGRIVSALRYDHHESLEACTIDA